MPSSLLGIEGARNRKKIKKKKNMSTKIRFLHFCDVYEVDARESEPSGGVVHFAATLNKLRQEQPNSLLFFGLSEPQSKKHFFVVFVVGSYVSFIFSFFLSC